MKTFRFSITFFILTTLLGCSSDDDNNDLPATPNAITWNMTHVVGGFAGVDQTTPTGLIQWTFNSNTGMLDVLNNNMDEEIFDFFDSGTYPYSIQNDGTENIITIDGVEFGVWTESQNEIIIDQQVVDGFTITLTR